MEEKDGKASSSIPDPRRPDWPEADYIVGNPPFIGGKDIRASLGDEKRQALWRAHPHINESADFVMYWWDRAADLVAKGHAKRFGFVTTNSITQVFSAAWSRDILRRKSRSRWSWRSRIIPGPRRRKCRRRADRDDGCRGRTLEGVLREVTREAKLDTDQPEIELPRRQAASMRI